MYLTPSSRATVFRSFVVSRKALDDRREMTRSRRTFDRSAMTSSVRPSAKYAFSGSVLRLVNGSTAIDFTVLDAALPRRASVEAGSAARSGRVSRQASISDLYA